MLVPDELETPAVVVDAWRLERNLTRMAAAAGAAGVALRPHAKTHKCLPIAGRQLSLGAAGLTVATLLEAELFASQGCPSVFIAYPLWAGSGDRGARLAALRGLTSLRVGVDSEAAAAALAAAAPGLAVLIGWTFAFLYHLLNGVRHLFWDVGYGFERTQRYASGWLVVLGSMALTACVWVLAWSRHA